jgi:hypothetical protein
MATEDILKLLLAERVMSERRGLASRRQPRHDEHG